MCDRKKAISEAKKAPAAAKGATAAACAAPAGGGVVWKKQPGATDEDLERAKKMWEEGKKRRLADGTKPKTVEGMEALECSDKQTVIEVGPEGNSTDPGSWSDASDPKKGTGSTIKFNPDKKGNLSDGTPRDPESSLAHEAYHSYEMTQGTFPTTQQGFETSATAAENEHRKAKGLDQRKKYGDWDIPQK